MATSQREGFGAAKPGCRTGDAPASRTWRRALLTRPALFAIKRAPASSKAKKHANPSRPPQSEKEGKEDRREAVQDHRQRPRAPSEARRKPRHAGEIAQAPPPPSQQ